MAIYAISDLHLSHQAEKPMDVFGWEGYQEKIKKNWCDRIGEDDTVLMAGDFSWGMYLEETVQDFQFINDLPGKKILLKGNHDYWWDTVKKMKEFLHKHQFDQIDFLHNNHFQIGGIAFCGTKGFDEQTESEKIKNREIERFKRSFHSISKVDQVIGVFHYPPYLSKEMMKWIHEFDIKKCLYGHLHQGNSGKAHYEGVECILTSCDYLKFIPLKVV